jgi:hypothetical protein
MSKRGLTGFCPFRMRSMVLILSRFRKSGVRDATTPKSLSSPNPELRNREVRSTRSTAPIASHPTVATPPELLNKGDRSPWTEHQIQMNSEHEILNT